MHLWIGGLLLDALANLTSRGGTTREFLSKLTEEDRQVVEEKGEEIYQEEMKEYEETTKERFQPPTAEDLTE